MRDLVLVATQRRVRSLSEVNRDIVSPGGRDNEKNRRRVAKPSSRRTVDSGARRSHLARGRLGTQRLGEDRREPGPTAAAGNGVQGAAPRSSERVRAKSLARDARAQPGRGAHAVAARRTRTTGAGRHALHPCRDRTCLPDKRNGSWSASAKERSWHRTVHSRSEHQAATDHPALGRRAASSAGQRRNGLARHTLRASTPPRRSGHLSNAYPRPRMRECASGGHRHRIQDR